MSKEKSKAPSQKSKVEELTADLQRERAEFQNYRRRNEEGRSEILDLAKKDVIMQLLPLLDNIERALAHMPQDLEGNEWAKGIGQVAKQAEEALRKLGIEKIVSIGEPFDPHLHEAVGGEGDIVAEELQAGYKLGEKVIRHSIVRVKGEK